MNPYQSLTKVYTQIGVWENWENSIKNDVEKKWLAILTMRDNNYRATWQEDLQKGASELVT